MIRLLQLLYENIYMKRNREQTDMSVRWNQT